jgi:heme/copper-type cytochrome/quinol oxidase subunit 2
VRERFAVPVRHLVFEPGSGAQEPDKDTEARYRQEFVEAAAARKGKVVLGALAGVGILAALLMSTVALIRSGEGTPAPKVVDLKVIASYKLGPDGTKHDVFTKTNFAVKAGQPMELRIDNTDSQPHSITSPAAGVNIIVMPGTHTYTLLVFQTGRFVWLCTFLCDAWAMQHPGYMRGYITAS